MLLVESCREDYASDKFHSPQKGAIMFFSTLRGIMVCLSFFLFGCVHLVQLAPEVERKWIPYRLGNHTYFILETLRTACGKNSDQESCRAKWEKVSKDPPPWSKDEIMYWADYGDGFQRTRITKKTFCAITKDPETDLPCNFRWKTFWQLHKSKET